MKRIIGVIIMSSLVLISCKSVAVGFITTKKVKRKVLVNPETNDSIVFIPMTHIARPSFYSSVKANIDSLRKSNFTIIYEGIKDDASLNKSEQLIIDKKIRKLLGFHLSSYQDSLNKSLPKAFLNKKYVAQSKVNTGIIPVTDLNIDLSSKEVIDQQEKRFGEINLSECDLNTPLNSTYNCKNLSKSNFYAVHIIRENHLMKNVKELNKNKIVIVYGKAHWKFVYPDLFKMGFRLVEGTI